MSEISDWTSLLASLRSSSISSGNLLILAFVTACGFTVFGKLDTWSASSNEDDAGDANIEDEESLASACAEWEVVEESSICDKTKSVSLH